MDYNRVVKDLNGYNTEEFLQEIRKKFDIEPYAGEGPTYPEALHNLWAVSGREMVQDDGEGGNYYRRTLVLGLDVSILQKELLEPVLPSATPEPTSGLILSAEFADWVSWSAE